MNNKCNIHNFNLHNSHSFLIFFYISEDLLSTNPTYKKFLSMNSL
nr:MAG TPA_asm: hypothetical protein [Caudoviricetes sp.]